METMKPGFDHHAHHADVLICGGGISGLSLAAWLDAAGVSATVLDKNASPGGVIQTLEIEGFRFERGPNTLLDKHESMDGLLAWAGLEAEAVRIPLKSQKRHVWLRGRLHEVPTGPGAFLASPLLPIGAKLGLLREPFVKCKPEDESVADFVRRRLGEAWVRNLITPMVSGIWAGDPERLSIEHAFPIMKQMERDGGSLTRGAMRHMKRKKAEREAAGKPKRVKNLLSFKGGLETLPLGLAKRLGSRYRPSTTIEAIAPLEGGGFAVETRRGGEIERWTTWELAIAAEAAEAARWTRGMDSELAAVLDSFPYNRLVVASLGIERAGVDLPEGFGFLAPRGEALRMLGAILLSNFMPERAPKGCAAMSIFIGGELDPAAFELDDDEIYGLIRRDLRTAVGWKGEPKALHIERWPRAIPQYDMRHGARLRQIGEAEARWPGLSLMGNWRGGVSVPDRVEATMGVSKIIVNRVRDEREKREERRTTTTTTTTTTRENSSTSTSTNTSTREVTAREP
jgi:oxygen-dependent protoporphyrinogen oxidase